MRVIPLTQGQFALIDDEDYENIINYPHPWRADKSRYTFYAASWKNINGKQNTIRMQNLILTAPKGKLIDHINRNGLDNRRKNLRIVTQSENLKNTDKQRYKKGWHFPYRFRPKRLGTTSKFKGVSWQKAQRIWTAYICIGEGRKKYLGCFKNENDAARAHNRASNSNMT